jgi:hypothetical protein
MNTPNVPKTAQENEVVEFCPISGDQHRYFIFKTFEVFEPYILDNNKEEAPVLLYQKNEYAILGCNCGSAIKTTVKKGAL